MHCISCIVIYALYSMNCMICIILYGLYYFHYILCIVCIILCALYSMHCIICIVWSASYPCLRIWTNFETLCRPSDRPTNQPTIRPTDNVKYRAAIAANKLKQTLHNILKLYRRKCIHLKILLGIEKESKAFNSRIGMAIWPWPHNFGNSIFVSSYPGRHRPVHACCSWPHI